MKKEKPLKTYRNPIFVAMEYKNAIANGQVSSESALARKLGISRVRVNQMIKLLKLDNRIVRKIIELGDPLSRRIVTERMLRPFVLFSYDKQKQILSRIADLSS